MTSKGKKLTKLPTNDETCVTFVMNEESHTIGQCLHKLINNQPEVEMAGYSEPHILEKQIYFRIQTKPGTTAVDSLRTGLQDFQRMMKHIDVTFDKAVEEYKQSTKN